MGSKFKVICLPRERENVRCIPISAGMYAYMHTLTDKNIAIVYSGSDLPLNSLTFRRQKPIRKIMKDIVTKNDFFICTWFQDHFQYHRALCGLWFFLLPFRGAVFKGNQLHNCTYNKHTNSDAHSVGVKLCGATIIQRNEQNCSYAFIVRITSHRNWAKSRHLANWLKIMISVKDVNNAVEIFLRFNSFCLYHIFLL